MKTKLLPAALVAAVGVTLAPGLARASEPVVPVSSGDLILGFQLSGDNDVEVDLGPYTNFLNATTPFNISFGVIPADQTGAGSTVTNLNADLTAVFGSGWASNSGLQWGIVGHNSVTDIFLTQDAATISLPQDPGNTNGTSYASTIQSLINGLGGDFSTTNSTEAASVTAGSSNAWDTFLPGSSSAFGTGVDVEQLPGDGATGSTLSLFELYNNGTRNGDHLAAADIGSFSLDGSGDLTFTPASVPEPSTWASLIGGTLFLSFFRRRGLRVP
jgi:hypothetical protein